MEFPHRYAGGGVKKPLTAFDHLELVRLSIGDASRAWAVERDGLLDQIRSLTRETTGLKADLKEVLKVLDDDLK
jgi:hypothetical protein